MVLTYSILYGHQIHNKEAADELYHIADSLDQFFNDIEEDDLIVDYQDEVEVIKNDLLDLASRVYDKY